MTIAADITAVTTAIAAITDANTRTALTAVMTVINDLVAIDVSLQTQITANVAVDVTQQIQINANIAAIAANPYIGINGAKGITPAPVNSVSTAGVASVDSNLDIAIPGRVNGRKVSASQLNFTTASLPGATRNVAYTKAIVAAGGSNSGLTYTVVGTAKSGVKLVTALPVGMTMTSGTLGGTPTVSGSYVIVVTVTDSNGDAVSKAFPLIVT